MPFYKVTEKGAEKPRLIEADNPAAALKFVAETHFTVSKPLKSGELVGLLSADIKVEKVGAVAAEPSTTKADDEA